jgi:hypothetical protein
VVTSNQERRKQEDSFSSRRLSEHNTLDGIVKSVDNRFGTYYVSGMRGRITHIEFKEAHPYRPPDTGAGRRVTLTIEVEEFETSELARDGGECLVVCGDALKGFDATATRHVNQEKADRDRMSQMNGEHAGWSGCPDCGQLPCMCEVTPGQPY